jgi:peroxiredoxin
LNIPGGGEAAGPVLPPQPPVPSPGDPAPDFSLPQRPGEPPFRLRDHVENGPVILLFFPMAFSPLCTDEICTVTED